MLDTQQNNQQTQQPNDINPRFIESPQFLELLNSSLFYGSLKRKPLVQHITVSVTGSQTIPHNLGRIPNVILVQPNSSVCWSKTAASDANNIYLRCFQFTGSPAGQSDTTATFDITLMYLETNLK